MPNITLSIDEDVLKAVRQRAAEQNSSVNAMVRDYLTNLANQDARIAEARKIMRELSEKAKGRPDEKHWTREELYDR